MGQAKRRGTREQRVALATAAAQQTAEQQAEARRLEYQSTTPQQRSQRLRLALLLAAATSAL